MLLVCIPFRSVCVCIVHGKEVTVLTHCYSLKKVGNTSLLKDFMTTVIRATCYNHLILWWKVSWGPGWLWSVWSRRELHTAPVICWRSTWTWGPAGLHRHSDRRVTHSLGLLPSWSSVSEWADSNPFHRFWVQVRGQWGWVWGWQDVDVCVMPEYKQVRGVNQHHGSAQWDDFL